MKSLKLDLNYYTKIGLKKDGFEGFYSFKDLEDGRIKNIPDQPGVYIVLGNFKERDFLEKGIGGYFKGKNPNVSIQEKLKPKQINGAEVLYIGQTTKDNLRHRIDLYRRFGNREGVGHWGGRYIWQIKNAKNFKVCWKICEKPKKQECELLVNFKKIYNKLPFANIKIS